MELDRALSGRAGHRSVRAFLCGDGRAAVREALQSMIGNQRTIRSCRLTRVHFKPGRKLATYFDVTLGGVREPVPIAATFSLEGATSVADLETVEHVLHKDGIPFEFERLFAEVPAWKLLVQASPLDPVFPGLGPLSDPSRAPDSLATLGNGWGPVPGPYLVRPVRYRPGQRHVLEYRARRDLGFFVKLYKQGRHSQVAASVTVLADVLDATGLTTMRVVRPAAVWADTGAILYPKAPGVPLSRWLGAGEPVAPEQLADVGRMLRAIHSSAPPPGSSLPERTLEGEISAIDRACQAMRVLAPESGATVASIVERARQRLESSEQEPAAVVHGDMKADHLLMGPEGICVLDADRCSLADPALDLGKLLADLRWWSFVRSGNGTSTSEAALLAGYGDAGPRLTRARLYAGLLLAKMAARRISVARYDWAPRTARLLALAGQSVDNGAAS